MRLNCLHQSDRAGPHSYLYIYCQKFDYDRVTKLLETIDFQTIQCHNGYMNEIQSMFANAIDNKVIDNLTPEQLDMVANILKGY